MRPRGLCVVLLAAFALSGCTSWRAEAPLTGAQPPPLALEVDNAAKTVDLSYRFSGDDERWEADGCRQLVIGVYERSGYLVNQVPWATQPGQAARVRIAVAYSASRGWLYPSAATLGALPGYGQFTTIISSEARSAGVDVVFSGQTTAKSFTWLPLFWLYFGCEPIATLQREGIEELVGRSIIELREHKVLRSP